MRTSLLAAAAAALLALPALPRAAEAQQDYRTTVLSQLDAAARPVTQRGFQVEPGAFNRDAVVGMLKPGTTSYMEINLTGGVNYFIAGACDGDCTDMDLRLFAPGGREPLASDVQDDDVPMLNFTATRTGRYMLAVDMAKCSETLCYYGYRIFRK